MKRNITVIDVDKWGISSKTVQGSAITAIRVVMIRANAGSNTRN